MADGSPPIGRRIRQLRTERELPQRELAERAGVSVDLVSKLEQRVKQTPSLQSLGKIAAALGVEVAALLSHPDADLTPAEDTEQPVDAVDVARLVERSDIGPGTLDTVETIVDRLCRDYSRE